MSLKAFTNSKIRKPKICPQLQQYEMHGPEGLRVGYYGKQKINTYVLPNIFTGF